MKITKDYTFIWDLDGTLIDSYKVIVSSLFTLSNKYNLNHSKDEINKIVIQNSVTAYIELLSKHTNINNEQLFSEYRALNELHKDDIELVSNARETFNKIVESGALNFIYTHRGSSTHYLLDRLNIKQYFKEIITSENKFKRKPSGDAIRYLIDKYKLNKEYIFYVGDRNIDVDCAKDANVKAILYRPINSYCIANGKQDMIVEDLLEIVK